MSCAQIWTTFCARSVVSCLRSAAHLGASGHVDRVSFSCWWVPFSEATFGTDLLKKNAQWNTRCIENAWKYNKKETSNQVEKACTKCVRQDAIGHVKNEFSDERVTKSTRSKGADKSNNMSKKGAPMQIGPRNPTKNDASKQTPKKQKMSIMIHKSVPTNEFILGVPPPGAPLVSRPALGHLKWAPSAPKVLPIIEKKPRMTPKSPTIKNKNSKNHAISGPGLADCAKLLQYNTWRNQVH